MESGTSAASRSFEALGSLQERSRSLLRERSRHKKRLHDAKGSLSTIENSSLRSSYA